MSNTPRCHLTAKDFSILEIILQRGVNLDKAFLRLLRRKLSTATVLFQDDIDASVATINSLVDFTVDRRMRDSRILTYGDEEAFTGMGLPITELRGLALLGLPAGKEIAVEGTGGAWEQIRLNAVAFQPEADERRRSRQQLHDSSGSRSESQPADVSSSAREKPRAMASVSDPFDQDDGDPGPQAA